jgi:hypothetical protein
LSATKYLIKARRMTGNRRRSAMADIISTRRWLTAIVGLFEHAAFVVAGLVLMVLGLALGVTMIMLPAGIVIGLIGVLMVVGGLFAHIDRT